MATFRAASSAFQSSNSDTSVSVAKPAGLAAGDLMFGFGGSLMGKPITPPSGWAQVQSLDDSGGFQNATIWLRTADAGDAAASSFAFTFGTNSAAGVAIVAMAAADGPTVVSQIATQANTNASPCPDVTPPAAASAVIWGLYQIAQVSPMSADRGTERVDSGPQATAGAFGLYTEEGLAATPQTGAVITKTGFGAAITFAVAMGPAAGGGGSPPVGSHRILRQAVKRASTY